MIKPTKGYIIIDAPDKGNKEEKTEGGIYLPERKSEVHQTGTVVGGEGYKKGDVIWYRKWAGEEVTYNKKKYLFIHVKDIIGSEIGFTCNYFRKAVYNKENSSK